MVLEMCILRIVDIAISLVGLKISNIVKVNMGVYSLKGSEKRLKEGARVVGGCLISMLDLMLGMVRDSTDLFWLEFVICTAVQDWELE